MSTNKKTLIDGDFQVGSNHFVVDTENNYVGFNNTTPQNKIDVQIGTRTGTHSTGKPLYVTGVTSTSGAEFVSDDGTAGIGIGSSNIFTTGTNQNLTIAPDGTGAIGIKTATPNPSGETFDLWVQGNTKITGNVTVNEIFGDGSGLFNVAGTQWVSSSEDIYFLNNTGSGEGKVGIGKTAPDYKLDILDSDKPTIRVKSTSTGDGDALLILDSSATGESDIDFNHDGVLNWRIRTGDDAPSGLSFQINNASDSDVLTIQQNGNVGIGTDLPDAPLEVNKSAGGEMLRLTTSTGTLYAGIDADPPWFGTSSDDHLRLMTNGTEKVRIENGGNVGIGVTIPTSKLHVDGTVTATSFSGIQVSDVPTLDQDTTGNAGSATNVRVDRSDTGDTSMYLTMVNNNTAENSKRLYMDTNLIYDNTNNRLRLKQLMLGDQNVYGLGAVTGNYGTVQTIGTGKGSYEGYSIDGQWVFMSNGAGNCGIYNDTDNIWATRWIQNGSTDLYHNGNNKFQTTSDGAHVTGKLYADHLQIDGYVYHNGDTDTYFGFDDADHFRIVEGGGTRFQVDSNGRVGIGTDAPSSPLHVSASTTSTHTMKITHNDTNATSGTHALLIDANYSGSDTFTGDKTNAGIYIDLDSSATGGDTSHEHRIYGVYSDVRHTGDSDICYSGYFYARSDHTTGQCSTLRGVYASSVDSANGTNSNNTAGEFKALKDGGSTNTTTTMMGVRAEVEIDAGTVTNAYAVHGHIDRDGGTITNGFLFHGSYAGTDSGVKWGLHLSGDEKNHVDGSFGIGTDAPSAKLDVNGNVRISTPSSYNPALQLGTQTSYIDDQLYSLRWGGNTLMGMGLHSSTRGAFGKQGLAIHIPATEEFSVKTNGWTTLFAVDGASKKGYFNGNVGIGTTSPSSPLDVVTNSEGNYIARFFNTSTASDQDARIVIETSDAGGEAHIIFITTNEISHSQWQIMAVSGDGKLEFQYQNMTSSINYNEGPTKAGFITRKLDNVSLNFTGQHRTFIKDTPFSEAAPLEGLIVSADQNKYVKMSGGVEAGSNAITINESLPIVSLAKKANDKKCFGVISTSEDPETREESYGNFVSISQKEVGDTRVYINSVGEGSIWVTNVNGPLESGDYITTSNIVGYGMRQNDDILHNYTVAKITMDCNFEPVRQPIQVIKKELTRKPIWFNVIHEIVTEEEYKKLPIESQSTFIEHIYTNEDGQISSEEYNNLDPIIQPTYTEISKVVYRKTIKERSLEEKRGWEIEYVDSLENVLDEYGEFQWEDTDEFEMAYKIRYLDADGNITDEANAVHTAAFVGCTYHCG